MRSGLGFAPARPSGLAKPIEEKEEEERRGERRREEERGGERRREEERGGERRGEEERGEKREERIEERGQ